MAENILPDPPVQLKAIQSYMKIATDIERVNPVVAYWVRLYSTESALKIDKDSPECKTFLGALILWLEKFKQTHKDNESVTNQTVGQAYMENFIVALFTKADTLDREGTANKNTVRMFYMSAVLFEAMAVFGPLTEEVSKRAKYAKFKAAYIQKCLKTGQTPKPGPIEGSDLEVPSGDQTSSSQQASDGGSAEALNDALPKMPQPDVPNDNNDSTSKRPDPFILTPSSPPVYPTKPTEPPSQPTGNSSAHGHSSSIDDVGNNTSSISKPSTKINIDTPKQAPGSTIDSTRFHAINGTPLDPQDLLKSQKYCKFANSALQYDDIPTAVDNLQKALQILTTGQKPD